MEHGGYTSPLSLKCQVGQWKETFTPSCWCILFFLLLPQGTVCSLVFFQVNSLEPVVYVVFASFSFCVVPLPQSSPLSQLYFFFPLHLLLLMIHTVSLSIIVPTIRPFLSASFSLRLSLSHGDNMRFSLLQGMKAHLF